MQVQKKTTKKEMFFHFICFPILSFIAFYIIFSLISYLFKGEFITSSEDVILISAGAIGLAIAHWIDFFYPSKPSNDANEHKKSLKEYVKHYVLDGSPFNRCMIMIYSLSIIIVMVIVSLRIKGYL